MVGLQREAYICKRAYELASSGAHIEPITIVSALIQEGYPEAGDLLKVEKLREDLRTICAKEWRRQSGRPRDKVVVPLLRAIKGKKTH